jgi:hypothetical protein
MWGWHCYRLLEKFDRCNILDVYVRTRPQLILCPVDRREHSSHGVTCRKGYRAACRPGAREPHARRDENKVAFLEGHTLAGIHRAGHALGTAAGRSDDDAVPPSPSRSPVAVRTDLAASRSIRRRALARWLPRRIVRVGGGVAGRFRRVAAVRRASPGTRGLPPPRPSLSPSSGPNHIRG